MHLDPIPRRVVIVENNKEIYTVYRVLINQSKAFQVAALYSSPEEALRNLRKDQPNILILSVDDIDDAERYILGTKGSVYSCKILCTATHLPENLFAFLKFGIDGFLLKKESLSDILKHLESLADGGAALSRSVSKAVVNFYHRNTSTVLTPREMEVLRLMAQQKTFSEIAQELLIARETARSHIRNIYLKLKVNRRSELLAIARKDRLL